MDSRERKHLPARICIFKSNAEYAHQNINPVRRNSKLAHAFVIKKILGLDFGQRSEILMDSRHDSFGILWRFLDKKIDITGVSGMSVRGDSVASDDHELNSMGQE